MFEVKSPEEIKRDILENLQSDLHKQEGGFADDMAGPLALELHKLYDALHRVRSMVWVDENSGPYLDMAAEDLGLEPRKEGTRARAGLLVTGDVGYLLPAGSTFLTGDSAVFDTDVDTAIGEDGTALAPATAREVGAAGNVDAGTIVHRRSGDIRIRSVTNPEPARGGADPESDTGLYKRIVLARQRPATSGNKRHYEDWALETPGVGVARVFPLWNGNGTVKVLVADADCRPVDSDIVAACAAHIEKQRPTTARVTVVSAEPLEIHVSVTVHIRSGADRESARAGISERFSAYLRELAMSDYRVQYHRMGAAILKVEGVEDYGKLRLNGQRADVALAIEQIPVLGEVAVTWI